MLLLNGNLEMMFLPGHQHKKISDSKGAEAADKMLKQS